MYLNRLATYRWLLIGSLSLTGVYGCSSSPSRFYLLEPIPGPATQQEASGQARVPVALAPVRIPKYADRAQIVTATAPNVYHLSELDRWAEALDENITRVLVQNLSELARVDVFPTRTSAFSNKAKFRISVQILDLFIDPQGQAELTAQWLISRNGEMLLSRQTAYRSPASTNDYSKMVSALNDCLSRMSRDVAAALSLAVGEQPLR